jgi:hypothetical protein
VETLQADFKILPIGIAEAGAWNYAFIYEMVHRHYPDLPEQARAIRQGEARRHLAELYFRSVGAARERDVAKLFGWSKNDLQATLDALVGSGADRGRPVGRTCAIPSFRSCCCRKALHLFGLWGSAATAGRRQLADGDEPRSRRVSYLALWFGDSAS